ncbi:MAG: hypothetical protein KME13_16460 [Myxacorys californica WJT36-NPBG1]|nr:hypothetical protein [Myxacorys californica WJT36-NPBG1]
MAFLLSPVLGIYLTVWVEEQVCQLRQECWQNDLASYCDRKNGRERRSRVSLARASVKSAPRSASG